MNDRLVVLIVEDHPAVLDSLKLFVESFEDVQIYSADSFSAAVVCIDATAQIDLLLCDVLLPGMMNGLDVAEAAVNAHPNIAVVLLSADPPDEIPRLTGRYSFLRKPFGRDAITEHIDKAFLRLRA